MIENLSGNQMLLGLIIGLAVLIFLVLKTKIHAFVALIIATVVIGVIGGMPLVKETFPDGKSLGIIMSITKGFGGTLSGIGIIIGFGVRPQGKARDAAEKESVQIKTYSIIYKAIEDIDAARIGMLAPTEEEVQTGCAEVRDTFRVPKAGLIAGCMVTEGEISRDDKVRVVRDGVVIFDGEFGSMRRFKDDVKTVKNGYECGLGIEKFQDIKVGDIFEAYKIVEVARTE